MGTALRIESLSKQFKARQLVLSDVSLEVRHGEMVALIGASGSGKSTLLRHIAGLVASDADAGSLVEVDGVCVQRRGKIDRDIRRTRARIGFVFQQFNLVDRLPVMVNVLVGALHRMPWWRGLFGLFAETERRRALQALTRVGIADCALQRASTLSGGQQQRAAIARTLLQGARLILADEPIASLDPESSRRVMDILSQINREDGCTVVVSLHQVDIAMKYCPRVIALREGRVVYDGPSSALTADLLLELYGVHVADLIQQATPGDKPAFQPPVPPVSRTPALVRAA